MTSHAGSRAAPVRVRDLLVTHAPAATILIRLLVGSVFLTEGVQKFLYPAALGAGRFANIGIPAPEATGPFVGAVEAVGGVLLLLGCLTRLAALVLTINIAVALVSTKLPVLFGHDFGPFHLAKLERYGFLSMMHEARADWSMLLGAAFLLAVGAGPWSVDARLMSIDEGRTGPGPSDGPVRRNAANRSTDA